MPFDGIKTSPVTQTLLDGRQHIEAGWCQGVLRLPGAVCAVGALSTRLLFRDPEWRSYYNIALTLLTEVIGKTLPSSPLDLGRAVVDWNDDPRRTKAEVLAAYDRAIALSMNMPGDS